MTTILMRLNNPYVIGALLLSGMITDLVLVGQAYDLSKSDWGTWVGSIGTVATLAGTVWIANTAERKKEREQLNLALISAAGLVVRLQNVHHALASAENGLPADWDAPDDARTAYAECLRVIDSVGLWEAQDLVPLVHLPNQAAANLAWVLTNIRSTRAFLQQMSKGDPLPWVGVEKINMDLSRQLQANMASLDHAQHDCVSFLVKHGFRQQ
jgi:hypothetical protein